MPEKCDAGTSRGGPIVATVRNARNIECGQVLEENCRNVRSLVNREDEREEVEREKSNDNRTERSLREFSSHSEG